MQKSLFGKQNRLFELARRDGLRLPVGISEPVRIWIDRLYPILALLFCVVTPFAAGIFAVIPILFFMVVESGGARGSISPDIQLLATLISGFLPMFFMVWLWAWLLEKRHLWTLGLEKRGAAGKYLKGGLAGLLMFSAAVGVMGLFGFLSLDTQAINLSVTALGGVLLLVLGWIVQGGAEEVLTRGYLLPVVGSRYGAAVGIFVSSTVFAFWHLINPNLSWLAVINLALFGVFASLYSLYEGGIWGVCALHSVWNWVQGNFFGFEVSGSTFGGSTFMKFREVGPDWFTGGAFGPEGGLAVTLVLMAGCLWVVVAAARRRSAA
jgi:membrane protease YdiL (CAAX protease family)